MRDYFGRGGGETAVSGATRRCFRFLFFLGLFLRRGLSRLRERKGRIAEQQEETHAERGGAGKENKWPMAAEAEIHTKTFSRSSGGWRERRKDIHQERGRRRRPRSPPSSDRSSPLGDP